MGKPGNDTAAKVAKRVAQEKAALAQKEKPVAVKQAEIDDRDVIAYLQENRLGDAKLYARLHRDTVVYVKYWERFLIWGGHHWIEDDYEQAFQRIEDVCALYIRVMENKQNEADDESDKELKAKIQNLADMASRRVNILRDKSGMENLMLMLRRIRSPLIVLPKHIDKQHYIKACPNGVIDLRTGELR